MRDSPDSSTTAGSIRICSATTRQHYGRLRYIEEQDGAYLLKADRPGVKKDDTHVELHDGYLTLKGERTSENEKKQGGYKRYERVYGSFERTFRVPEGVTEKDIKANYRDGVLELTIPAPKAEKPKAIDIRVE